MLKCLVKGHDLKVATYLHPHRVHMPVTTSINLNGTINIHRPKSIKFVHSGLITECERCEKTFSADNLNLPTIQPYFTKDKA